MELADKLALLADAAKYDASCASSGSRRKRPEGGIGNTEGVGICHSYTPDECAHWDGMIRQQQKTGGP